MARTNRVRGFTLVELLVVITIIGMLMALLLPAIQSAREAGRRNTCSNNMRQVSLALTNFSESKRAFPGYANAINYKRASWVVSILPFMERNDLYQMWQNVPAPTTNLTMISGTLMSDNSQNPWASSQLGILVCPSNPASNTSSVLNPLSYVVNCGSAQSANDFNPHGMSNAWVEDINSGVFFNNCYADNAAGGVVANPPQTAFSLAGTGKKVSMDFISTNDGSSNTLMVSENLQASNWAVDPITGNTAWQSEFQIKQNTGFVWYILNLSNPATTNIDNNESPPYVAPNFNFSGVRINGQAKNVTTPMVTLIFNSATTTPPGGDGGLAFSRPSSAHPGGVNAMFCDGHLRFIAEDIGYNVYTQLMTPRQKAAIVSSTQRASDVWRYQLNEADF